MGWISWKNDKMKWSRRWANTTPNGNQISCFCAREGCYNTNVSEWPLCPSVCLSVPRLPGEQLDQGREWGKNCFLHKSTVWTICGLKCFYFSLVVNNGFRPSGISKSGTYPLPGTFPVPLVYFLDICKRTFLCFYWGVLAILWQKYSRTAVLILIR